MIDFPNDILIHLWLGFLLILACGCVEGIRRLTRRSRIARGNRE